jgi:hypothetical protein
MCTSSSVPTILVYSHTISWCRSKNGKFFWTETAHGVETHGEPVGKLAEVQTTV